MVGRLPLMRRVRRGHAPADPAPSSRPRSSPDAVAGLPSQAMGSFAAPGDDAGDVIDHNAELAAARRLVIYAPRADSGAGS